MLQLRFQTAAETQCDDDKLGYKANTKSYDTPPLSLQVPTFKTIQQTMQVPRENHEATKPPPANQHWAVMLLCLPILMYDMQSHSSSRLQDILQSTRNAQKVMLVITVSTDQVSQVKENPAYVELGITFYPHSKDGCCSWILYHQGFGAWMILDHRLP
jgi:hypothetical protein